MPVKPAPQPNRKDGRYSGYVFLGYTPDGHERRKYVYGKTKKELDDKLLDMKIQQATGQLVGEKIMLKSWSEKWIKNKRGKAVRTFKMYRDALDRYIIPELGDLYLTDIKPFHIQDLINDLSNRPRTAQIVRMTLDQIFKKAIMSELLVKNPADMGKVDMPSARAVRKRTVTKAELDIMDRTPPDAQKRPRPDHSSRGLLNV